MVTFRSISSESPQERQRRNSLVETLDNVEISTQQEKRRIVLNEWLLNRKDDNRSVEEQETLKIFYNALKARLLGELGTLLELATGKIATTSKGGPAVAGGVALASLDIISSIISEIPFGGMIILSVGNIFSQKHTKNSAGAATEKLGDVDDIKRIIQDFSSRIVAYYQHEIIKLQENVTTGNIPSVANKIFFGKEILNLSDAHHELINTIIFDFLKQLKMLDIKKVPIADMGAHLARSLLLINREAPVLFSSAQIESREEFTTAYHLLRVAQLSALLPSKIEEMVKLWKYNQTDNYAGFYKLDTEGGLILARPEQVLVSFAQDTGYIEFDSAMEHPAGIGKIHQGFYEDFQKRWGEIKPSLLLYISEQRQQSRVPEVWFTGHGLGGAFAVFAAAELILMQPDIHVHIHTFGQLRVGDEKFKEFLERNVQTYHSWIIPTDPFLERVSRDIYIDMGMPRPLLVADPKNPEKPFNIQHYQECLIACANLKNASVPIHTDEDEFQQRLVQLQSPTTSRYQQEQQFRQRESRDLLATHDEPVERLSRIMSRPIEEVVTTLAAPEPKVEAKALIQNIYDLIILGGATALETLITKSFELQNFSVTSLEIGFPYETVEALERIFLHRKFEVLPVAVKLSLFQCYEQFMWLSFIQSKIGYTSIHPDLLRKLKEALPDKENNSPIYFKILKISSLLQLMNEQKKVKNIKLLKLIENLYANVNSNTQESSSQEKIDTLEGIWNELRQPSIIPPDYRDILFFTFLHSIQNPDADLIQWIQRRLWRDIMQNPSDFSAQLAIAGLEFLLKQLHTAPDFICEMILVGDKEALGLRHWLDDLLIPQSDENWILNEYPQILLEQLATQQTDPLLAALTQAKTLHGEPVIGHLGALLLALSENHATEPQQRLRYLILRHYLQNMLTVKPTVEDYLRLAEASENLHRDIAKKAYLRAQVLTQEPKTSPTHKKIQQGLSRIYTAEGDELQSETSIIPSIKMYAAAVEADGDNNEALGKLFDNTIKPTLSELSSRLNRVGTPIAVDEKQTALDDGQVVISGIFSGNYILKPEALAKLLNGDEFIAANISTVNGVQQQEGQHKVAVIGESPYQLHLKKNAGSTGLATAAHYFYHIILGLTGIVEPGLVPVEPLKIERKGKEPIYVQASPTVSGETLKQFFDKSPEKLEEGMLQLDPLQLSSLIVASFFLDPEDGRPPNILVTQLLSGLFGLMSVDNDHVWIRETVLQQSQFWGSPKTRPLIKNILYCFPQMRKPVPQALRDLLLSPAFSPISLLKIWLQTLRYYNMAVEKEYTPEELKKLYELPHDSEKMMLEAFFDPDQLSRLYVKFGKLRKSLQKEEATLLDVLETLQPELGKLHRESFTTSPDLSPKMRFDQLTKGLFDKSGGTKKSSADIPNLVLGKISKKYIDFKSNRNMPEDLLGKLSNIHHEEQLVELIINDLKVGRLGMFRNLFNFFPELQESVLKNFSFSDVIIGVYTQELHQEFLDTISSAVEILTLRNNSMLSDIDIIKLIERLPNLKGIKIINCECIKGIYVDFPLNMPKIRSIISTCSEKDIRVIEFVGCLQLQSKILDDLEEVYGGKKADILVEPNGQITEDELQIVALRQPQWGLPIRTTIATTPIEIDVFQMFPDYQNPIKNGEWDKDKVFILQFLQGNHLAAGFEDGSIRLINLKTGEDFKIGNHDGAINSICSISRTIFVSGGEDGVIKVWDLSIRICVATMQEKMAQLGTSDNSTLYIPSFFPIDDKNFIRRSKNGTINVWNISKNKTLYALTEVDPGWFSGVTKCRFDGYMGASGSEVMALSPFENNSVQYEFVDKISSMIELNNGLMVFGMENGSIISMDLANNRTILHSGRSWIFCFLELSSGYFSAQSKDKIIILNSKTLEVILKVDCSFEKLKDNLLQYYEYWSVDENIKQEEMFRSEGKSNLYADESFDPYFSNNFLDNEGDSPSNSFLTPIFSFFKKNKSVANRMMVAAPPRIFIKSFNFETCYPHNLFELDNGNLFVGLPNGDFKIFHVKDFGFENLPINLKNYPDRLKHNFMQLLNLNKLHPKDVPILLRASLKLIDVSSTPFSDILAKAVLDHCPNLKILKHDNCPLLTEEDKQMIADELAKRQTAQHAPSQGLDDLASVVPA